MPSAKPATMTMDVMPMTSRLAMFAYINIIFWGSQLVDMDDVQYLLSSAKEESYLLVVDSRMRDTAVFPTPSEYSIQFSSPFRNVFGLDVLDATIARTEYIVDSNTNTLEYVVGQPASLAQWAQGAWALSRKRSITLDPGDYNLPQLVRHLNDKFAANAAADGAVVSVVAATNPAEVSNRVVFVCDQPFMLLMDSSTLRHTLGFGDPVTSATSADYAVVPGWSVNQNSGASHAFLSRPTADIPGGTTQTATIGPVPAGPSGFQYEPVFGATVVRQYFTSAATGPASAVSAYMLATPNCPAVEVSVARASDGWVLATGSVAGTVMAGNADSDVYDPVRWTLTSTGLLEQGVQYYLQFAAPSGNSGAFAGVYYNEDNLPVPGDRYIEGADGEDVATLHMGSQLCCDVTASAYGHAVRCPGVVNLTGPRYVNIRCPEIESHLFRDRVNEACHAGLGMVQLRGYGFRESRFDYVSFPPRRFHPLGRLSKLTIRLERPDGSLYDSHGIDHSLLVVLKYYSLPAGSSAAAPPGGSMLNPEYVPDLRQHLIARKWHDEARAMDHTAKRF